MAVSFPGRTYLFYWKHLINKTVTEVIKRFSYSTQLSTKFILLINVKMPTIVGILPFISMINTTSQRLNARIFFKLVDVIAVFICS